MNDDTGVPAAVFALKPERADLILSGAKTVEIRRSRMNRIIGRMLIYRTGTGLIVGEVRVKGMYAAPPEATCPNRPSGNPCPTIWARRFDC